MSKLLEELNPAQREVVTHGSGPLLIIAGPGSGKTETVVRSIAYAIEDGQGKGDHPVTYVNWYAAMDYAQWAGKRLPTEAEWEKAAREGLTGETYQSGDFMNASKANYNHAVAGTISVRTYPPNNYGLYDMTDNVREWCLDEYNSDFYKNSPRRNPMAGSNNIDETINSFNTVRTSRVLRGNSWRFNRQSVQVTRRFDYPPMYMTDDIGFRCAKSVTG